MGILDVRQNVKHLHRFNQIISLLWKYEYGAVLKQLHIPQPEHVAIKETGISEPEKLRRMLEELGGSFIKFGQLLSVRPDLIPKEYCDELSKLQDDVTPFSSDEAKAIVEKALGRKLHAVFKTFSDKPLAAASIAQVHEAALKNGKKVAVKVQRPEIKELFETDIAILKHLAHLMQEKMKPELFSPKEIVEEFEDYSRKELDFNNELKNHERFYVHFLHSWTTIIPKVYGEYSSSTVLVSEKTGAVRLKDAMQNRYYNKQRIAHNLAHSLFEQMFAYGFFHADPHPGNVMVARDNRIVFLDFGIVGYLTDEMREAVTDLFIAAMNKDVSGIADNLLELGFIDAESDVKMFKEDVVSRLASYYDISLEKMDLAAVFSELFRIARKNRVKLPSSFVLLGKSMVTLHGVTKQLDPKFNLVQVGRPYAKGLVKKRWSPSHLYHSIMHNSGRFRRLVLGLPRQSALFFDEFSKAERHIAKIDEDVSALHHEMELGSTRIVLGLMVAALLVAGALLVPYPPSLFLGLSVFSVILFGFSLILAMVLISFSLTRNLH